EPKMTIAALLLAPILIGWLSFVFVLYAQSNRKGLPLGMIVPAGLLLLYVVWVSWSGILNRLRYPVISQGGLTWHRGWRGATDWLRYPFSRVKIQLNPAELDAWRGQSGTAEIPGLKRLLRGFQGKTNGRTGELFLSKRDIQRINRLAFTPTRRAAEQRA